MSDAWVREESEEMLGTDSLPEGFFFDLVLDFDDQVLTGDSDLDKWNRGEAISDD